MKFETSWPHPNLFSNKSKKLHWAVVAKSVKEARFEAWASCMNAKPNDYKPPEEILVSVTFTPPVRRGRKPDRANMPHSIKAHLDGISDAVGLDDAYFKPVYTYKDRQGSGKVEFELMPFEGEIE